MQAFIARYYRPLIATTGVLVVISAFYTGFLEGKRTSSTQPVTLSCKDNILDKLSIPLH